MVIDTHRHSDKFMLRLPDGLRDAVKQRATQNRRSMTAEIVSAIQNHLDSNFAPAVSPLPQLQKERSMVTPHIGKKCIIRTYASGVHFGTLIAQDGRQVELQDARRLWRWHAVDGISLSEVALNGIAAAESRVCCTVPSITVLDALEILPASEKSAASIEAAPVAVPR